MILGCIIQGDIRVPLKPIVYELSKQFDFVVVSTWKDNEALCPAGDYELILNEKPAVTGVTNRNLQRYTTARGLELLADRNCTHVLKWRTDMLPTRLNVNDLLRLSQLGSENELGGRVVTGSFRHLSVNPDWFSSFPDLYSFSTMEGAQLLWSDDAFSYELEFNMPDRMQQELNICKGKNPDTIIYCGKEYSLRGIYAYDAHTELYAIFKDRIERKYGINLTHQEIIRKYFTLINDDQLGICWFNPSKKFSFRPIRQGFNVNWWKEYEGYIPRVYSFEDMQLTPEVNLTSRLIWAMPVRYQIIKQFLFYLNYVYKLQRSRRDH